MSSARIDPHPRLGLASAYALVGFFTAVVVHASTYTTFSMSPANPLFWILHVGIFPIFIPMVLGLRKWSEVSPGAFGFKSSRLRWRELLVYLPPWTVRAGAILFAYAVINFLVATGHLPSGTRASHSATVNMDPEQARYLVRAFSGHWLVFYAVPLLYFLYVPSTPTTLDSEPQSSSERSQ